MVAETNYVVQRNNSQVLLPRTKLSDPHQIQGRTSPTISGVPVIGICIGILRPP